MRVRHAEPRRPGSSPLIALALIPTALFLSWYLSAGAEHVPGGRDAAAWGLAVQVALAAVAVLTAGPRDHHEAAARPASLALWLGLPAAVQVWMGFDLLSSGSAAGVWAASPSVAGIPAVIYALTRMSVATEADEAVLDLGSEVDGPASAAGEDLVTPERPPVVLAPTGPTGETGGERPEPHQVLDAAFAVGVHSGLWTNLVKALGLGAPRLPAEQGGVALTTVHDGITTLIGVVLPKQLSATSVRCEFSVLDVERIRDALDVLEPRLSESIGLTWVHTHPGLGVFLSTTDVHTTATWRSLDPGFKPIVVDISRPTLDEQIGVFDATNHPLQPVGLVEHGIDPADAAIVRDAILDRYRRTALALPKVLVGRAH